MELSHPIYRLKRQARLLSRELGVSLHTALDEIAKREGFSRWSHLVAKAAKTSSSRGLLDNLRPGDLALLGGKAGHGKTMLGLETALTAVRRNHEAAFFSLAFGDGEVADSLVSLGANEDERSRLCVDTSEEISAEYVVQKMDASPRGTLIVIDYLQVLDLRRVNAALMSQVRLLRRVAHERGWIVLVLSQIDRRAAWSDGRGPSLSDIRLPNPLDLSLFSKACFVHERRWTMTAVN